MYMQIKTVGGAREFEINLKFGMNKTKLAKPTDLMAPN